MPIDERMGLAEGRPLDRRLFAAMAQQDCGQCGYLCETYSAALARGEEKRTNLCAPGGKDTSRMVKRLLEETSAGAASSKNSTSTVSPLAPPPVTKSATRERGYSRDAPVDVVFRAAYPLNGPGSAKEVRHVVFDIGDAGIAYEPGDSFGVFPTNDPTLVDAVLAAMRAPPDFPIGGKSFRNSLIEDYSLSLAPDALFELIGYVVGGERRKKAKLLAKGADPDGDAATFDVLAALQEFGPLHPDPEAFLECLEPLQPRLYSIASSPLASPGEVHLTVDAVRYSIGGRRRLGVGSTFLADRALSGSKVKAFVQKAHAFALPADPTTPLIMVGPGTGVAPFRSFLWHRRAMKAGGQSWLFFGHQHENSDFLYRDEIEDFLAQRTLTRLSTAWSRDGARKVYVQDRMREAGSELWAWLKSGAHFRVCGDAKRMAKDVEAALAEIAATHGRMSETSAKGFVVDIKDAGIYQADVY
jgi:sulfite reductase (NADPH) flavoprotein alpha-component